MKKHILKYLEYIKEIFDYNNYNIEEDTLLKTTYSFILGDITYKVFFNNLKDNHYHLSFTAIIDDVETYELLKDTRHGIKVLSNVKNVVDMFVKSKNVDILIYESLDIEREYIYLKFGQHLKITHFDNFYTKDYKLNNENIRVFILVNNGIDYKYYLKNNFIENNILQFMKK